VYLHCRAGWQRSSAVATGVLALRDDIPLEDALAEIRQRRPEVMPLQHQWEDLEAWHSRRIGDSSSPG
jgi:protein-tyrosine phosphatase